MSITIKKYIDIVSGVAGAAAADRRELMQRIYTINPLVPVNSVIEITTLQEVGTYFGTDSEEYLRSIDVFGFISKSATQNKIISFAGYSDSAVPALIIGNQQAQVLADLNSFAAAVLTITIGGLGGTTPPMDLSVAGTISAAMTIIETAVQALDVDPLVSAATVVYEPVGQRVILTAGVDGEEEIIFSSATADFLSTLGWAAGSAISDGTAGETFTEVMDISASGSDNFGSFLFTEDLDLADIEELATWNHGQNVKYFYCVWVEAADAQLYYDTLKDYSGTALTLITDEVGDYAESIPAILMGATDYDSSNSVINYMYQVIPYPVSVDDTATSDAMDEIRVNYNGQTQQAGSEIFFYQRGLLLGPINAPLDMNTYANEVWFKDAIIVALLNLFLAVERVPANTTGVLTLTTTINGPIGDALDNGTISVGKTLTDLQVASIKELTGNDQAAAQVENAGYWLTVEIVQDGDENNAVYTLIYSKDDVVRKITGSQILI